MTARRRVVFVVTAAVLGIALAAVVTWGTSRLVSQHIGLASEPLTAGQQLLPRAPTAPSGAARRREGPSATTPSTPARSGAAPATTQRTSTPAPTAAPSLGTATAVSEPERGEAAPEPSRSGRGRERGDSSARRDD